MCAPKLLTLCTHDLSLVHVVSACMLVSPDVEVWQSGHGALEVILLHPGDCWIATGDDDGVLELDGAC